MWYNEHTYNILNNLVSITNANLSDLLSRNTFSSGITMVTASKNADVSAVAAAAIASNVIGYY